MASKDYGDKEIGARIRKKRIEKGISMEELAEKIGIDYSALSKIEKGTRAIQAYQAIVVADILEISCDYLLRGIEAKNLNVASELGLRNGSIEKLCMWKKTSESDEFPANIIFRNMLETLNNLLESQFSSELLYALRQYSNCKSAVNAERINVTISRFKTEEEYKNDDSTDLIAIEKNVDFSEPIFIDFGEGVASNVAIDANDLVNSLFTKIQQIIDDWSDDIQNAKKD